MVKNGVYASHCVFCLVLECFWCSTRIGRWLICLVDLRTSWVDYSWRRFLEDEMIDMIAFMMFFFPPCQGGVRFYVSSLSFSPSFSSRQTSPANPGSECYPPDLNRMLWWGSLEALFIPTVCVLIQGSCGAGSHWTGSGRGRFSTGSLLVALRVSWAVNWGP